ncbi:MAG: TetR family transcriptional regulator C-terminal domain-containing protein [Actinomycetota bacterium]
MSGGDSQTQILDAVQAVIVRDGVRGASMRQVAQEADVSLGLLSYHFDDKESLIVAAFERATARLREASEQAMADITDPRERVRGFLRGAFSDEFLDGDYLRLRISLWAVALTDDSVAAVDARFFEEYAEEFRTLIADARPDLSTEAVRSRAIDAIALSNGIWLNWARYANADDLELGLQRCEEIALG